MRIVVHGQQAFGKAVLEALLKRGEEVVAVYVAPEKPGQKADPLKEAALAAKLPVYQPASYRKPEVWEEFRALKPDLQVMAFVTLFVPEDFLNIPTKGSIQYHPSLLPAGRGPSAINWPIIKGETETGLSIFWPDNGLDTGEVLRQGAAHQTGRQQGDLRRPLRPRQRPHRLGPAVAGDRSIDPRLQPGARRVVEA
jgi:methionyl-tRNA formyltransferase